MNLDQLNKEIITCRKCPRLVAWREEVAQTKRRAYMDWDYWGKPVPGFGDPHARVLVVGLAPGAHGSNRTGRQFTGDDNLLLKDMYITASGRCAPPGNKPTAEELNNCQPLLERELEMLKPKVIVCLGRIAFERILRIYSEPKADKKFAHNAHFSLAAGSWLVCSYHPSQQNTLTGKLTVEMLDEMWAQVRKLLDPNETETNSR